MHPRISGARARRWRKQVASHAKWPKEYVRTLKFPLDISTLAPIPFESVVKLYETTEGIGKGSLTGLLCATHLSGFRFFGSAGKARIFLNSSRLPTGRFAQGLTRVVEQSAGGLSPDSIIDILGTQPRGDVTYESKPVASRLHQLATGKKLADNDEQVTDLGAALMFFESQLKAEFPDRIDVAKNLETALRIFDASMATKNFDLPSLESSYLAFVELAPEGSTIVYDANLPTVDLTNLDDTALHAVVAQKLLVLDRPDDAPITPVRKEVQYQITTQTHNALSWLFGKGLSYWKKATVKQIMADYCIPKSKAAHIRELKSWFDAIPSDNLFSNRHYSDFRSSLGGKLDAWVANYLNRLDELNAALAEIESGFPLPEQLLLPESQDYFSGTGVSGEQLKGYFSAMVERSHQIRQVLGQLAGKGSSLPGNEQIVMIEKFSDELDGLAGIVEMLHNRIAQEIDSKDSDRDRINRAKECDFKVPAWLRRLPKINRISGGIPDIEAELGADTEKLSALRKQSVRHREKILEWARLEKCLGDPVENLAKTEQALLEKRGNSDKPSAKHQASEQARRKVLHRLARLAVNGGDALKRNVKDALLDLFISPKELNRLIFNGQGAIYRSPFSRSRHDGYDLNEEVLKTTDLGKLILRVKEQTLRDFESPSLQGYRDLIQVEFLETFYLLAGLPDILPSKLAEVESLEELVRIPTFLRPALGLEEIQREHLVKCMNLYVSETSGILARLFREKFTLKTKFLRVNKNALYYCPKDKPWQPPEHYFDSKQPIGEILGSALANKDKSIPPRETLEALLESPYYKKERSVHPLSSYLSQAPHDWFLDLGIVSVASEKTTTALKVAKKTLDKKQKRDTNTCPSCRRIFLQNGS